MRRADRIGALVVAFAVFAAYLGVANWLNFLGLLFLPLGLFGTDGVILIMVVNVALVNLYVFRQRKRVQKSRPALSET